MRINLIYIKNVLIVLGIINDTFDYYRIPRNGKGYN